MFSPGETIVHSFAIPFAPDDIEEVIVTYKQKDHVVAVKSITEGFEPITEPVPPPEPERQVLVFLSGATVSGTKLVLNPSIEPQPTTQVIGSSFEVDFTQQESLTFVPGRYEVQINVLTFGGDRCTSSLIYGDIGEQHVRMVMPLEST